MTLNEMEDTIMCGILSIKLLPRNAQQGVIFSVPLGHKPDKRGAIKLATHFLPDACAIFIDDGENELPSYFLLEDGWKYFPTPRSDWKLGKEYHGTT